MKKWIIKTGVLALVFAAALVISSLVINSGTEDDIVDMGSPSLPRISFEVNGQTVNTLFGYVDEMEITAMRDTITPLESTGVLTMDVEENGNTISGIRYDVYSLDGTENYSRKEADVPGTDETVTLELNGILTEAGQEAVLKVTLTAGGQEIRYYTRIVRPDEIPAAQALAFVQDFHTKALEQSASDELEQYLEPGEESDNSTYQTVNIHSDITHIQWGTLNPQVIGDVEWSIKECNNVYTSILAKYQVVCEDDDGVVRSYDVKEFFRVRVGTDRVYLLNYNRNMEQVFDGNEAVSDDSILLGIASSDIPFETNEDETIVAFVQNRDLWLYNSETGVLSQVFSFASSEGRDARSRNDQHDVRVIHVDDSGNLAFAVYGYMNRGVHEGQVGVGIYYFDVDRNVIEEKAFIPSTKSFAIAEDELGKMVFYDQSREMLYVLAAGTLYQVNLDSGEQTVLAENLEEGQYAVSDDGRLMAYQTDGELNTASGIMVMNLQSGDSYSVEAADGEAVRPLGFVNSDFIYGKINPADAGTTASGQEITPIYEMEIRSSDNETVASYSFSDSGIYITDILISDNLVTVNRVVKSGDIYNSTSQEYVTNNVERQNVTVEAQTYSTDRMQRQVRITFGNGIESEEVSVLRPNQLVSGEPLTITLSGTSETEKYYVYGMGELDGIYDRASYAIQRADEISGVVISSSQAYVWERGNRNLVYSIDVEAFRRSAEETSLAACRGFMEQYGAVEVDLTGCTLEQVLYVINKGCPVIALTSADHAILLTGYTRTDITYIDPDTGTKSTVSQSEMEGMVSGSGNTFIGYIR